MTIDPSAFERYRRSANEKTTLFRLIVGVVLVAIFWFGFTFLVLIGGAYVFFISYMADGSLSAIDSIGQFLARAGENIQQFMSSHAGVFATLLTFAGLWIGLWVAMRFLHKERLSQLFGNGMRLSASGMWKGFAAVAITSSVTELGYLAMMPQIERGPIGIGTWTMLFLPLAAFAFVQTSAEELLFRGYLQRGLAHLFRTPLAWAVVPTVLFTALHWNPLSPLAMNIGVMIAIGAFAALLVLLVCVTGNLGAAMGAHLGNNLFGFAVISHEDALGGLALFRGASLESLDWTVAQAAMIAGLSIASILLTWLLLLHPRSPLNVRPEI